MDLAKVIKKFRREHSLTQVDAADVLDIPIGSLRDYEQGRSRPSRLAISALEARIRIYRERRAKRNGSKALK